MLFKHFPTKSALYAEILAEECEADPALHRLLELEPSTETLVVLIREMARHFQEVSDAPDQEEAQRLRLMITSHLDDGEFARLIYDKIGDLIGPVFTASLERAVAAGDAARIGREPLNLFWFAHHTVLMAALTTAAVGAVSCPTATPPISNGSFANSFSAALDLTKPPLPLIWTATCRRIRDRR